MSQRKFLLGAAIATGLVVSAALAPVLTATAHEGIGGSDYVHACVKDGVMKHSTNSTSAQCPGDQYPLHWVRSGTGAPGPEGPAGADGQDGADGADGSDGADGADGLPGADGADGTDGVDGVDGADGADGADGLPGADGADGTDGTDGTDGVDGVDGADGVSGWERVSTVDADAEGERTVTVDCTLGKSVVGGGFETTLVSDNDEIVVMNNYPSDADTWTVTANTRSEAGDNSFAITAWAICATVS